MADPRLLMRTARLGLLASALVGCAFGPVSAPRVAGRIVDKETRQPIAGAAIFANYLIEDFSPEGGGGGKCCLELNWAITDAEGRFEFPAHEMDRRSHYWATIPSYPELHWLHPSYGREALDYWPVGRRAERYKNRDWENLELEMSRDELFIRLVNESEDLFYVCSSHVDCWVACEAWFGGETECLRRSGGRRLHR